MQAGADFICGMCATGDDCAKDTTGTKDLICMLSNEPTPSPAPATPTTICGMIEQSVSGIPDPYKMGDMFSALCASKDDKYCWDSVYAAMSKSPTYTKDDCTKGLGKDAKDLGCCMPTVLTILVATGTVKEEEMENPVAAVMKCHGKADMCSEVKGSDDVTKAVPKSAKVTMKQTAASTGVTDCTKAMKTKAKLAWAKETKLKASSISISACDAGKMTFEIKATGKTDAAVQKAQTKIATAAAKSTSTPAGSVTKAAVVSPKKSAAATNGTSTDATVKFAGHSLLVLGAAFGISALM